MEGDSAVSGNSRENVGVSEGWTVIGTGEEIYTVPVELVFGVFLLYSVQECQMLETCFCFSSLRDLAKT